MATQRRAPELAQFPLPRSAVPIGIVVALVVWSPYSAMFTVLAGSAGVIQLDQPQTLKKQKFLAIELYRQV